MRRGGETRRMSNATIGLIAAIVVAVASYLAFTKALPWGGGTEYKVVFASAQNLRVDSPVRIAGVNVGKVTSVEPLSPSDEVPGGTTTTTTTTTTGGGESGPGGAPGDASTATQTETGAALVTLEIDDQGLPLKQDAHFRLRPRLFLEGNLFVDVNPGSPGAPDADPNGAPFSPDQTSNSVQLDQIFTNSLQKDTRRDLQVFLDQFGKALINGGGAESFRTLYKTSPGAFRSTSQVNEAVLGENPHDLSGLIKNLDKVVRGLGRNQRALQDTITNFRIVSGSFAAQDTALERAIIELPQVLDAADPAFANLNAAFPPLRAFAREALPGTKSAPATLDAATPLLKQVRLLSRRSELRGLARDLVPTVPQLAKLSKRTPDFLEQGRALASCFNHVIIPWSQDEVQGPSGYPFPAVGPVYKETGYGLVGIAGESRSQDANGQYIRVAGGGGSNTVTTIGQSGQTLAGVTQFPIDGAMPSNDASAKTPFKPNKPCENQETPDLRSEIGPAPTQTSAPSTLGTKASGKVGRIVDASTGIADAIGKYGSEKGDGNDAAARKTRRQIHKSVRKFYKEYGD